MAGTERPFTALAVLLDLVLVTLADLTGKVVAGSVALGLHGAMAVSWRFFVLWQLSEERERERERESQCGSQAAKYWSESRGG